MTKAIVLVSGGIDSTVALWWVLRRGWKAIPLTFDYFARAKAEKSAVRNVLKKAGIDHSIVVQLGNVKEVYDLAKEGQLPSTMKHAPEGYIPARNMIFYSIAAYYAEIEGADYIVGGHNRGDPEEFPDSGQSFFRQMNELLKKGLWSYRRKPVRISIPLRGRTKLEVVKLGLRLGAPLILTWSCRFDGTKPCGECSSCIERNKALSSVSLDRAGPKK